MRVLPHYRARPASMKIQAITQASLEEKNGTYPHYRLWSGFLLTEHLMITCVLSSGSSMPVMRPFDLKRKGSAAP